MSTYYVDATGGSDSNDGLSEANAWKTISKVNNSSFNPGDVIKFKCGEVWRERLVVPSSGSSGSSGNPITFTSYGTGDKPIINGASIETGWEQAYGNNVLIDGELEVWTSSTDLTNWTETIAGSSTVNQENSIVHGGSYASRHDIDGSNSMARIEQDNFSVDANTKYKISVWLRGSAADRTAKLMFRITVSGTNYFLQEDGSWDTVPSGGYYWKTPKTTTSYVEHTLTSDVTPGTVTGSRCRVENSGAASISLYFDDISIRPVLDYLYQKSFTNEPKIILEDGNLLTFVPWDTDIETTYASMSAGTFTVDTSNNIAYVWCTDSADPDTHTMEVAAKASTAGDCIYPNGKSYITIDGLELKMATRDGFHGYVAAGSDYSNITVQNCVFTYCSIVATSGNKNDANHFGSNITFTNNTVSYAPQHGIYFGAGIKNSTISHNTIHHCGWKGVSAATGGHGISMWSDSSVNPPHDNIIEFNEIYNIYETTDNKEGHGIQCDDNSDSIIIRYNFIHDNEGDGIGINANNGGHQIYYNICYNNDRYGFKSRNMTSGTVYIYNNVFYDNTNHGMWFHSGSTGTHITKNNIIINNGGKEIYIENGADTNFISDYNCVYHSAGGNFMHWVGTDYNWADWKTNSSQDTHSINSDPLFIDAANGNFHLQAGSPCINAGTDVGLSEDYEGTSVPQGSAPDIGAYEKIVTKYNSLFFGQNF